VDYVAGADIDQVEARKSRRPNIRPPLLVA
jgi:hypothetical protein